MRDNHSGRAAAASFEVVFYCLEVVKTGAVESCPKLLTYNYPQIIRGA